MIAAIFVLLKLAAVATLSVRMRFLMALCASLPMASAALSVVVVQLGALLVTPLQANPLALTKHNKENNNKMIRTSIS